MSDDIIKTGHIPTPVLQKSFKHARFFEARVLSGG